MFFQTHYSKVKVLFQAGSNLFHQNIHAVSLTGVESNLKEQLSLLLCLSLTLANRFFRM